ncbi:MAG: hypothetical protein L3J18_06335 [Candidatus Brocadia sp.]|nr:MAG: hypothetical protein L3J18_06335 [Candidatus Brocadia sp.]
MVSNLPLRDNSIPSAAQPQPNFLYESGEIASENALAMTATMHFDGTLHVVIYEKACQEKILSLLTKKPKKCFLAMRPFRLTEANQAIKS